MNSKDTICREMWAYPVINIDSPKRRVCCKRRFVWDNQYIKDEELQQYGTDVFLNTTELQNERLQMMSGERLSKCGVCWKMEDRGEKSFRLGADDFQHHFNNIKGIPVTPAEYKPFDQLMAQPEKYVLSNMPNKLDIVLGATCDMKCLYCNDMFSTQWRSENIKYGKVNSSTAPEKMIRDKFSDVVATEEYVKLFYEWFDSVHVHLERLALMGGEPTIHPLFNQLLDHITKKIREQSHPNFKLSIITNLNWNDSTLNKIKNTILYYSDINFVFEVSMESFGTKAEYIRSGLDWNRFQHNFNELLGINNVQIMPVMTINGLCISSLKDYLHFLQSMELRENKKFTIIPNKVTNPVWLSTMILNEAHSNMIKECIEWIKINYDDQPHIELISVLNEALGHCYTDTDIDLVKYFNIWINEIDRRRNTRFFEIFPEFSDLKVDVDGLTGTTHEQWLKWV
jgi:organic radical activating enzyme